MMDLINSTNQNDYAGIFIKYLSFSSREMAMVNEFLSRFKSNNTRASYLAELKKFFLYRNCNNSPANEISISKGDAASYVEYLDRIEGAAPKSILLSLSALCSYWEYLAELRIVTFNIFKGMSKKFDKKPLTPTKVLSVDQVREIIELSKNNILDYTVLIILFYTGIRVGELISLTRNSYREEEELGEEFKVLVFKAKGDKILKKVLNEIVMEAIEKYLNYMKNICREIKADDPLIQPLKNFYTSDGIYLGNRPISASLINKIMKKYFRLIGIKDLRGYSAHSARTTLVTRLIERGNDIYQVSKEIGHADVATTQRCYDRSKRHLSDSLLLDNIY